MNFKEKRKKHIQLDITPIVDTVFNLLIFFALSLNFTSTTALNLSLPKITQRPPTGQPQLSTIQINRDQEIRINNDITPLESLPRVLSALRENSDRSTIIIQADKTVPHGLVVTVMDMSQKSGFEKISIAARIK